MDDADSHPQLIPDHHNIGIQKAPSQISGMSPQSCRSARVAASLCPVYYFLIKAAKFGKLKPPIYICGSSVSFFVSFLLVMSFSYTVFLA